MKRLLLLIMLFIPFTMWGQSKKVSEEEFNELILGKWKLVEMYKNNEKEPVPNLIEEYQKNEYKYIDYTSVYSYTWKFFDKQQVLILNDKVKGELVRYKFLSVTQDTIAYETVIGRGLVKLKCYRLKN